MIFAFESSREPKFLTKSDGEWLSEASRGLISTYLRLFSPLKINFSFFHFELVSDKRLHCLPKVNSHFELTFFTSMDLIIII